MKKRFIFDETYIKKYAKKGRLKWLIIGLSALVLIVIVIIVILATRNNEPDPVEPAIPTFELKEELTIEAGSLLPEVTDYFDVLENIDPNEIVITYPDEFELSYDTSLCSEEEIEEIYSEENPDFEKYDCVENYLITPTTYGITIELQGTEYTVNLTVEDTRAPSLITKDVEIYEGDTYELEDFVDSCNDATSECTIEYVQDDTDEEGNPIDYANITDVGEHTIKIVASDEYGNITDPVEATLTILEVEGNLYTIKFDSAGGTQINDRKVGENGNVIEPTPPTRDGYNFLGWYLGDEKFDFNTKITSDLTLTAKWEEISEGGGSGGGTTPPGPINVTSVSLNFSQIGLTIGQTKTVIAYVYPTNATNKTVTWSSANPNIATVSNGNITGVSAGSTVVTATAGGRSASVTVIVSGSCGTSCRFGDANYNTSYILSVNLTQNNCAIDPNSSLNENLSVSDYTNVINDINAIGIRVTTGNIDHRVNRQKIKNSSGTGLVGYQITITTSVIDPDNPYMVLSSQYILRSDGSRQFLTNNICKNGVCLSS